MFGLTAPRLSQNSHDKISEIVRIASLNFPQLEIEKIQGDVYFRMNGKTLNRFDFYASTNGAIESIAIYGSDLRNMLLSIQQNRIILGLKAKNAYIDSEGIEDFLNVELIIDTSLEG